MELSIPRLLLIGAWGGLIGSGAKQVCIDAGMADLNAIIVAISAAFVFGLTSSWMSLIAHR